MWSTVVAFFQRHSGLSIGPQSHVKFTRQSKNSLCTTIEQAIFRNPGDTMHFSCPADYPLDAELEYRITRSGRQVQRRRPVLPDNADARDDAADATVLAKAGGAGGGVGGIFLFA